MAEMRALTIRQPWPWAIVTQGKDVENRTWKTAYRGRLAIHAASQFDDGIFPGAFPVDSARRAYRVARAKSILAQKPAPETRCMVPSAVIAVAELAGIHHADECRLPGTPPVRLCSPWAVHGEYHWELKDVRVLDPVACHPGRLGLWTLPEDVASAVRAQLEAANAC